MLNNSNSNSSYSSNSKSNVSLESIRMKGYKEGSIVRVQMHNFISYDDAVVYPGPKLNIVLGPNGTGKSALTHAICLTCGGSIKSVGRSDDTSEYVKRNSKDDVSFCEVDILRHDSIVTVRRYLYKDSSSSKWTIDGKPTTQLNVKQLMKSLNIDLNNLCSFMPQDRVGAFTQQSAKGILEKTLECIKSNGERNLLEEQSELAEQQKNSQDQGKEREIQQQLVSNLQNQLNGMKSEVERIRQRAALEEKVKMYEVKIIVKELQEASKKLEQFQIAVDEAVAKYAIAKDEIKPIEKRVRDLERQQSTFEQTIRSATEKKNRADEEVEEICGKLNEDDVGIENAKQEIDALNRSHQQLHQRLLQTEEEIRNLENSYNESIQRVPIIEEKISQMNEELSEATNIQNELNEKINDLQFSLREPTLEMESVQRELDNLRDPREIFCSRLDDREQDVIKAYRWISENKSNFRGECYGPIGMEIQVKKYPGAEHILEKYIPRGKLLAFVVETKEDEILLNEELRNKRRLNININTMYNRGSFNTQFNSSFFEQGRRWGLQGLIADLYEMPDLVRAFLNTFLAFNCGLWAKCSASSLTPEILTSLCIRQQFRLFVVETKILPNGEERILDISEMSGKISRYNPNSPPSTKSEPVKPAKIVVSSGIDITEKKENLEKKILKCRLEVESKKQEIEKLRIENHKYSDKITQLRAMLVKAKSGLDNPKNIKRRLDTEKKKKNELENRLAIGAEKENNIAILKLERSVDTFLNTIDNVNTTIKKSIDATIQKSHALYSCRSVRNDLSRAKEDLEDANQKLVDLRNEIQQCEVRRDHAKAANERIEDQLTQMQEKVGGEQAMNDLFRRFNSEIVNANTLTLEELENKAAELRGQLNATVENPQLMKRYEALTVEFEKATEKLKEMTIQFETAEATFKSRSEKWESAVSEIARKLNGYFSRYMSELQYRGAVELIKQGSLKDYEMQMSVSFRDNVDIHKLSGQRHSGGERAVSTIMYLMALQELTTAPFRVVDEINQGMDERNERLVFDRIVRSCSSTPEENSVIDRIESSTTTTISTSTISSVLQKPQYFLVSPKLLEGLRAMDNNDVTVLLVWNGPGVASKWQFSEIISSLRKRKERLVDELGGSYSSNLNSNTTTNINEDIRPKIKKVKNERN